MEEDEQSTPQNILDRQTQAFQFRIQENLMLHDDEIERLANHLNNTKSKILEAKVRVIELGREIRDVLEFKSGDERRREATVNAAIAKFRAVHHQHLQQLQAEQTDEIEAEQRTFESQMNDISSYSRNKLQDTAAAVDQEIFKLRAEVQAYRDSAEKIQEQEETVTVDMAENLQNIDHGVIDELQNIVNQRNQERFQNLQQSREKLSRCVETLDQMVRSHTIAVEDRRRTLREIEQKYEASLAKIDERHKPRMARLTDALRDVQARTRILARAAHHLEHSNQKQLKETLTDLDSMKRRTLMTTDQPLTNAEDLTKVEAQKKHLMKIKRGIMMRDDALKRVRQENESLKKDVWRIRHELRFRDALT
jgi:hypothetical protein